MKRITFYLAVAFMVFSSVVSAREWETGKKAHAQEMGGRLEVTSITPQRMGNQLKLDMLLRYGNLYLSSTEELHVTPIIAKNGDTVEMPSIIFTGNTRNRIDPRLERQYRDENCDGASNFDKNLTPFQRIVLDSEQIKSRRNCGTSIFGAMTAANPTVAYVASIPFASWMNGAEISLKQELFGCGGDEGAQLFAITTFRGIAAPMLVYVTPVPQVIKERSEEMTARVIFEQDKIVIKPALFDNRAELDSIYTFIQSIMDHQDYEAQNCTITGYASPEGPYKHNEWLAQQRVKALQENLMKKFPKMTNANCKTAHVPEDWDSVSRWVAASDMKFKTEILDIIKNTADPDARDAKIRALDKSVSYNILYKDLYPMLRRTVFHLDYNIIQFSVERGREVIFTNPQNMNLHEMQVVANSFPENSSEFLAVQDVIMRFYPNDPSANTNIATAALKERNLPKARMHLSRVANSPEAQNNLGVLNALEGNFTDAERYFKAAIANGSKEAQFNLDHMYELK